MYSLVHGVVCTDHVVVYTDHDVNRTDHAVVCRIHTVAKRNRYAPGKLFMQE